MTNNTSAHANCTHAATKSERAKCRRLRKNETTAQTTDRLLREATVRAELSVQSATDEQIAEYRRLVAEIESA